MNSNTFVFAFFIFFSSLNSFAALECRDFLIGNEAHPDWVFIKDIAVTGDDVYPLIEVMRNLEFSSIEASRLEKAKILLVAEGYSGFLPYLVQNFEKTGATIAGLDLWYGQKSFPEGRVGALMAEYQKKHFRYLFDGSAFQMPICSESVDFLFNHLLVNNVEKYSEIESFLNETIRVLKVGGEARIAGFSKFRAKYFLEWLEKRFPTKISIKIATKEMMSKSLNGSTRFQRLMVIRKLN